MGNSVNMCGLEGKRQPNEELLKFLTQVALFKQLPRELFPVLSVISKKVEFESGQDIIRQGEVGNEFFVIMEGEALVTIDGKSEARLKPYDYFGERSLLHDSPRAATITADAKVVALTISRDMFQNLGLHQKLQFPVRKAVGGGKAAGEAKVKPPSPKTQEERELMAEALRTNVNLASVIANLSKAAMDEIIDQAWKEDVAEGVELIVEGDLKADYFFIVQEGSFDCMVHDKQQAAAASVRALLADAKNVGTVSKGGSFGELALLYLAPRAATVKATATSVVWVIDRGNFKRILAKSSDEIALKYVEYLDKVEILEPLQKQEKEVIAKALSEMFFGKGEEILKQGKEGDTFYILIDGTVAVIQDGEEVNKLTATPDKAMFFGERALMQREPRNATIRVDSDQAKTLTLDRKSFDLLLGPLEALNRRGKNGASRVQNGAVDLSKVGAGAVGESEAAAGNPKSGGKEERQFGLIKMKDLATIGLLGNGGFGAVSLVEHVTSQDTYALKMLSKGYIVQASMQQSVIAEKNIQLMCDSTFVVKLFETYSDDQHFWLLLEAALGGELYATYSRRGFHGRPKHAKFYVAGVVFAFEHLHGLKVIYRDLKPENLLLTENGHVKLTDMGLAKVVVGKTYTTCGTPDYFAPEVIASTGHTLAVDWWTLGILVFELMSGHPPFEAATPMQTYQKVGKGINKVAFPRNCKGPLEDLIKNLCDKNPSKRLPMKAGGTQNIKSHPWISDFDWAGMQALTLTPPYIPDVRSKKDLANFHAKAEDSPPMIKYRDPHNGWDAGFATST